MLFFFFQSNCSQPCVYKHEYIYFWLYIYIYIYISKKCGNRVGRRHLRFRYFGTNFADRMKKKNVTTKGKEGETLSSAVRQHATTRGILIFKKWGANIKLVTHACVWLHQWSHLMDDLTPVFPFLRSVLNWRESNAHLQMRCSFPHLREA